MSAQSAVAKAFKKSGRPMVLRRVIAESGDIDVTVYGVALTADQVQFSNAEIAAEEWPGPPRKGDRILRDGKVFTLTAPAHAQYLGPDLLVHTCKVEG